ncbi:helix-turn-helix domain-containing protein [Gordonia sp. (in: high G+C Gram-positive bacteria)]
MRLRLDGTTPNAIAQALGIGSHNTVRRWIDAAELDPAYADHLNNDHSLV